MMTDAPRAKEDAEAPRKLQGDNAPSARSEVARHDDALSPTRALRDSVGQSGGQRVGDSPPAGNPVVSFPEAPPAPPDEQTQASPPRVDRPRGDEVTEGRADRVSRREA
jgi:hypothetical protein